MLAFRGGVAVQKIRISQQFSGLKKLLLVGGMSDYRLKDRTAIYGIARTLKKTWNIPHDMIDNFMVTNCYDYNND